MRMMILVASMVIARNAQAAECSAGVDTVLGLKEWSAKMVDGALGRPEPLVTITYKNLSDHPIKMIDASLSFSDALGERISSVALGRDIKIAAGAEKSEKFLMSGSIGFERLTKLDKSDAEGTICTKAVMYDDGTKQQF